MTIRTQILAVVAGISLLTIGAFGTVVARRVQGRTHALAHEAAAENAALIALVAERGLEKTGASLDSAVERLGAARWLVGLGAGRPMTRIQIFDSSGKLKFDSSPGTEHRAAGPEVVAALGTRQLEAPVLLAGGLVAAAAPIHRGLLGGEVLGAVRVIRPAVGVQEILSSLSPEIAALALVLMAVVVAAAYAAGRSISLPIVRLTEAARRVAGGERSLPFPAPRGQEVRELTEAYDDMRRELEDQRHIERLTQDLSHELKNPIAAVRALAEALEDGGLQDPDAGPGLVRQIGAAAHRLEGIVADVLALARLEARGLDARGRVELGPLMAGCLEGLAPRCRERAVHIDVQNGPETPELVAGDPVWLSRAIGNLLVNAVEHSSDGSRVTVQLGVASGQLVLSVSNPGEVPAAVRDRLFERFVTRHPHGTGLGLSIARGVAEAHGGDLLLVEAGPPVVRLRLRLPLR